MVALFILFQICRGGGEGIDFIYMLSMLQKNLHYLWFIYDLQKWWVAPYTPCKRVPNSTESFILNSYKGTCTFPGVATLRTDLGDDVLLVSVWRKILSQESILTFKLEIECLKQYIANRLSDCLEMNFNINTKSYKHIYLFDKQIPSYCSLYCRHSCLPNHLTATQPAQDECQQNII